MREEQAILFNALHEAERLLREHEANKATKRRALISALSEQLTDEQSTIKKNIAAQKAAFSKLGALDLLDKGELKLNIFTLEGSLKEIIAKSNNTKSHY